jgi:integrase
MIASFGLSTIKKVPGGSKEQIDAFLRSLGGRRHAKLGSLGLKDFLEFRNQLLAEGRTPQTVDQLVRKILSSPFALAVKLALLDANPLASLPPLKSTRIERGIFTAEEISKLLEKANPDWRGAMLVGYFTGARLKDVCNLRWGNVDLEKRLITFRAVAGSTRSAGDRRVYCPRQSSRC